MKITKIRISNLYGITEQRLSGADVEVTGSKGTGKTSIIDAIRYGLTNSSERDFIIRNGADEGEILIETDTGLVINRKKRTTQSDYKNIKDNGMVVNQPETFLQKIFTPIQLNPIEFTLMSKQEKNRTILDLIEFDWDLNWIKEQFGEIPQGVDYGRNILQVLSDIQADNGVYYKTRQEINRDIAANEAVIHNIAVSIPTGYNAEKWKTYDLGGQYQKLNQIQAKNNEIQRAKTFMDSYDNKIRAFEADKQIAIATAEQLIASEREGLVKSIERMKAEIIAAEDKINSLNSKLEDKTKIAQSEYETKIAKLSSDMDIAKDYASREVEDTVTLQSEISLADEMRKHINEYTRMVNLQETVKELSEKSDNLTAKIELARNLPGEILKTAKIPIKGMTVENGIPLINGLPISNLSQGEQLDLCVDVAISKPSSLNIILIDGVEKLDSDSRDLLYAKCKEKGLQFIAARTDDAKELTITEI